MSTKHNDDIKITAICDKKTHRTMQDYIKHIVEWQDDFHKQRTAEMDDITDEEWWNLSREHALLTQKLDEYAQLKDIDPDRLPTDPFDPEVWGW